MTRILSDLAANVTLLEGALSRAKTTFHVRTGELQALLHDAESRTFRRAAKNAPDATRYRTGGAFDPVDGPDLDSVALTGWLASGAVGALLLVREAIAHPDKTIVQLLDGLFDKPIGEAIRAWGVWIRWNWVRELYRRETIDFMTSAAFRRPWRNKPVSQNQRYLIGQFCLDLQIELRKFANRGQAFDWLLAQGDRPRFRDEPIRPDLEALAALAK